jgi:tRNA A37 threonylcarbamoyladenosine biosynthesis protein TsaE
VVISHLDLYRLEGLEGEDPALLDDYLGAGSIAFVEWPAAAAGRLPLPAFEVSMRHRGGDEREIDLQSASSSG